MKIERGIPIPPCKGNERPARHPPKGEDMRLAEKLAIGESLLFDKYRRLAKVRERALYAAGKSSLSRKIPGEGWRLWRIA